MREEDVLQVLGGSFFNSVLVDIEKNTYTRMNFAPWLLKISQTGMYTGLADAGYEWRGGSTTDPK